jgi:transcriptional regulator with XRE-family HTH domain
MFHPFILKMFHVKHYKKRRNKNMIYRFNTIGECCREWRRDKNISASDMAKYIGCCHQNITAFERGENISGRILLEYVARGLMILGVEDDLYICKDREGKR